MNNRFLYAVFGGLASLRTASLIIFSISGATIFLTVSNFAEYFSEFIQADYFSFLSQVNVTPNVTPVAICNHESTRNNFFQLGSTMLRTEQADSADRKAHE
ncbi:hypothetical protein IH824_18400 [candidate division KSB1 bacterium]|nr:hypothetical protein [candidate division KSB1 bacterium]